MAEARIDSDKEDKTAQSEEDTSDIETETLPAQDEPLLQSPGPGPSSSFNKDDPLNTSRGAKVRRSVSKSLSKVGRVFGQCKCGKPTCSVCGQAALKKYQQLKNEDYVRIPVIEGSVAIRFYYVDPPQSDYRTLRVTNKMTALDVCKALSEKYHFADYMDYAIIEWWDQYYAWRRLEDSELVLQEHQVGGMISDKNNQYCFVCRQDYDKNDWALDKFNLFYHPDEVRFFMDKTPIIDVTKPSPERILIRATFFHINCVGVDPEQVEAEKEQGILGKQIEEDEFGDLASPTSLPSTSSIKQLTPEEKKSFKDILKANTPSSPFGEMSKSPSKSSASAESPVKYAEIQPVLGKSPTSSLAGTSKRSDHDDDAKPSTSTPQYPEVIVKESISAENIEMVALTSKTSGAKKKLELELVDTSNVVKKSHSLGNVGMTSKPIVSPTTKKAALEPIDESKIGQKSTSLGNVESKPALPFCSSHIQWEYIDDSKDLLTVKSSSGPAPSSEEYPDPYKGLKTRWRILASVTRAIDLTRDDDKDYAYDPVYCGEVLVRKGADGLTIPVAIDAKHQPKDTKWKVKYLLLRNKHLYFASDKKNMYKFYLMADSEFQEEHDALKDIPKKGDPLILIGHVSNFRAYAATQCKRHFIPNRKAVICLRDIGNRNHPLKLMFVANYLLHDIECKSRLQWLTAIKFAQFGKQVLLNFFRHHKLVTAFTRGIVRKKEEDFLAMDFETGVGRIIQGEREIAEVKRAARHDPRLTAILEDDPQIFKQGAHLTQKYYHKTLTRDSAYAVLGKHKKEGEWLLRDSESRKGTMSIDYFCAGRVRHVQIKVATYTDPYTNGKVHVVTTDMDQAFYNVHSLIEFYRLNLGKNFRCILGQCLENPNQRDSSPPRLPLTIKVHTNSVAKYEQPSGSGLLSKLGSKIRGKESPDKK